MIGTCYTPPAKVSILNVRVRVEGFPFVRMRIMPIDYRFSGLVANCGEFLG